MKRALILLVCLAGGCAIGGGGPIGPDAASRPDGSAEGGCEAPSVTCGSDCADPTIDRRHCGGCDRPCAGECVEGECVVADCRTSELGCPDGTSCDPESGECLRVECAASEVPCGTECCPRPLFGSPEALSDRGRSLGLAIDASDQPVIAYARLGDPSEVVVQRRRNEEWEQSTVSSAPAESSVSLAIDGADRVHVLWADPAATGFSHAVDGGAAERFGDLSVLSPRLHVLGGGRPVVGFATGTPGELRLAERATIWVSEGVAERVGVTAHHAALALGPGDGLHVSYTRVGSTEGGVGYHDVRYGTRGPSGWSDEGVDQSGTDGLASSIEPQVAVDPSGNAHVLYWRVDLAGGADAQLWHAARSTDGSWYRAVVASSTGASRDAAIATSADGAIHIAYFDGAQVVHGLSRGRGFGTTSVASVTRASEIEIAVDATGAPHVLYAGADGSLHLAGPP